ncbi:helix-turn-helix domain-containing protein [Desulfurivibrio sp. C05AmB]|uniref:AlbA family DNA-binding domain-containing protein n=1 Tax=Desulfurivibrio sp. C05AmB TaxID=3374371 RepID=UPI00376EB55C
MNTKVNCQRNSDRDKIRFLSTVSSFANSSGGDIVYGIQEAEGKPVSANGVNVKNIDQEKLRLEQLIRNGIEPSIPNVQIHTIHIAEDRYIVVIRPHKSWSSPHRVSLNDHSKFYGRNSAGRYPFDVGELKTAFLLTENISNRIRNFKAERITAVYSNSTPYPLKNGARVMMHFIPLSSFSQQDFLSIDECRTQQTNLRPLGGSGWNSRINLDGFLNYSGGVDGSCEAYTQLYRTGVIETVCTIEPWNDQLIIPSTWIEEQILSTFPMYLRSYEALSVETPFFVFLTFIGVKEYNFAVKYSPFRQTNTVDLDLIQLPEIIIETYDTEAQTILRPLFDMVWNAWGYDKCYNYNEEGNWVIR